MSNHFHLVVTDRTARLPAFGQYLDSLVARAVNASLGRWESFWGPSSYSAVVLTSPDDILDKVAYVLANPGDRRSRTARAGLAGRLVCPSRDRRPGSCGHTSIDLLQHER